MYALLTGTSPFYWASEEEMACIVVHQSVVFPKKLFSEVSENGMDLLHKLLEKDPMNRISAEEALEHPWFSDTDAVQSPVDLQNDSGQKSAPLVRKETRSLHQIQQNRLAVNSTPRFNKDR
jgi:serine/threonine protein kinase